MKYLLIALVSALALAISSAEHIEIEIEINEHGCPKNFTIPALLPHEICNKFYQCVNGHPVSLDCPSGLVFNVREQICDWVKNVDCEGRPIVVDEPEEHEEKENNHIHVYGDPSLAPEVCQQVNTEYVLIAHENCDKFYQCWGGLPVESSCPDNLLFNIDAGYCDWAENTECQERIRPEIHEDEDFDHSNPDEVCKRSQFNGDLLPHTYCNWFYICSNGLATSLQCPRGLVYNIEEKACDWPFNVECGEREIVESHDEDIESSGEEDIKEPNYGHADPSEAADICRADEADGILVAHEHCNQFYKCWNGEPHVFDCSPHLHYNPEHGVCDWPHNVDCGNRIILVEN